MYRNSNSAKRFYFIKSITATDLIVFALLSALPQSSVLIILVVVSSAIFYSLCLFASSHLSFPIYSLYSSSIFCLIVECAAFSFHQISPAILSHANSPGDHFQGGAREVSRSVCRQALASIHPSLSCNQNGTREETSLCQIPFLRYRSGRIHILFWNLLWRVSPRRVRCLVAFSNSSLLI